MKFGLKTGTYSYYVLSSNDRRPPGDLFYALREAARSGIERSHMNSEFALRKEQAEVCGPILTRNARPERLEDLTFHRGTIT
jgi:hypothetical protein